jgi:hypothetical protein
MNADNTVSALSAADFRTAIGAGTSSTTGTVTSVAFSTPTGLTVTGSPITTNGTLALGLAPGYSIPTDANQTNWTTAFADRLKWDGGPTGLVAATGRTSLGGTTVGSNFFTLTNPSAITFPRMNADNTVSALSAADFRTAIGAGTSSSTGTVTSVNLSAPTGLTVSGGPITSNGTIALDLAPGYSIPTDANQTNWTTAFTDRLKWDGGPTGLIATTGRTSLGGTTVGSNFFTLTNPSAITFPRMNADNTVSALSAADFRTAIGVNGAADVWNITGNAGLNASNFIGTTDPIALRFKVENFNAGIITTNTAAKFNTSFGLGTSTFSNIDGLRNSAFGAGSMATISTGDDNTAIGQSALSLNQTGDNNTAIGQSSLLNTVGSSNTAVGQAAMQTNTNGFNNTAIGKDALFTNSSGENNTAIGHFSARLSTGSRNTALGQNSLSTTTGNDNVGIGFNAIVSGGVSNSIALGSGTNVTANNATAIGTSASNSTANSIAIGGLGNTLVNVTGDLTTSGMVTVTGARYAYRTSAVATTLTINDYFLKITANVIITLPDAVLMPGQKFVIFNGSGGSYNNFAFTAGQTIIGSGWVGALATTGSLSLFSDGANWLIESKN